MKPFPFILRRILVGLVVMCSLFSIYMAIRTSTNVQGKQVREEATPITAAANQQTGEERIKQSTLEGLPLYLNGRLLYGLQAYRQKQNELFFPLDALCMETGASIKVYNADGIVKASLFGQTLSFRIQEPAISVNGTKITLKAAPDTAMGHILVPGQLFPQLKGITTGKSDGKAVFLNAYPDIEKEMPAGSRVLRVKGKNIQVSDLPELKTYWKTSGSNLEVTGNGPVYLIRNGDSQSLLRYANGTVSATELSMELGDRVSGDGHYLYWSDGETGRASVYDIRTEKTIQLDDFYFKALPGGTGTKGEFQLYTYGEGKGYRHIIFENMADGTFWGCVERWDKTVAEGEIQYSPDHQRMLFYRPGKGFYIAKTDDASMVFVGDGVSAEWIHNRGTLVHTIDGRQILYRPGKGRAETTHRYRLVGGTDNGETLFTRDGVLFSEKGGQETRRLELPFECTYAAGNSAAGPLLVIPEGMNTGIYIAEANGAVRRVSEQYWLLRHTDDGQTGIDLKRSILPAPDGKKIALLQQQGTQMGVKLLDMTAGSVKTVILDILQEKGMEPAAMNAKWVSRDQLLVYTTERSWLIKAGTQVQVYSRYEEEGCRILGVF